MSHDDIVYLSMKAPRTQSTMIKQNTKQVDMIKQNTKQVD